MADHYHPLGRREAAPVLSAPQAAVPPELPPPPPSPAEGFGKVVGQSAAMQRLYPLCRRLAQSDLSVVIEGETGTGKEVLAESLHEAGPRRSGPFVIFDCTAVPANLVESALFGHERGSFTGATETRKGMFEEADGGTLLLDEIGDLDIELQAKLLRVLERSEVSRVGSNRWQRVTVRILAATRRNLREEVRRGRFRDDLYYRLAVTRIELPPLRQRHGDVSLLGRHFWRRLAGVGLEPPTDFLDQLEHHAWPGNVRELHNCVARRVALGELAIDDFQVGPPGLASAPLPDDDSMERLLALDLPLPRARRRLLEEFELRYVERALRLHDGNVTRAAHAAGVARRYFRLLRARNRQRTHD